MADAGAKAAKGSPSRLKRPAGAVHGFSSDKYYRLENTMNRTELIESNPMSITAFSEAIGLRTTAPQKPVPPRGGRVMSEEWHDRLRDMDDAAKGRHRGATVRERLDPEPLRRALFESTLGRVEPSPPTVVLVSVTKDEISKDIHRAEQSFVWREPVTVEEFLSGADGQYRSAFRQAVGGTS
jgi:hypothetical protein